MSLGIYSNFFPPSLRIRVNFSLPFDGSWVSFYSHGVWLKMRRWKKRSTFNCNPYNIAYLPYKKLLSNLVVIPSLLIEILVQYDTVSSVITSLFCVLLQFS
jgi:hypothetical protein